MSLLPPEVHSALTQLLQALSSSDNDVRSQAEDQLGTEWVAARPDVLLMGLVEQIQDSNDLSVSDSLWLASEQYYAANGIFPFRLDRLLLCFSDAYLPRLGKCQTAPNRRSCS